MRCVRCGGEKFERVQATLTTTFGDRRLSGPVMAERCVGCGEKYVRSEESGKWERAVVRELIAHGPTLPEALSFIRRAAGFQSKEIAELLGVTRESVSRWEHGKRPVDRATWLAIGALALDRLDGREDTVARLRALQKRQPRRVRLSLSAA